MRRIRALGVASFVVPVAMASCHSASTFVSEPSLDDAGVYDARVDARPDGASGRTCSRRVDWTPTPGCNGDLAYCDRRFDELSVLTTHNAFSTAEDGFVGPNQHFCLERQLEDGVRGFMLDLHPWQGEVFLCHGFCQTGRTRLVDALEGFDRYLARDPSAVVTLILENYVSAEAIVEAFDEAALETSIRAQSTDEAWPTLGEMIAANERIVVLTDSAGGNPGWLLPLWEHAFETPFDAQGPEQLRCEVGRGQSEHALFVFNHFLTQVYGSPALAEMINHDPVFIDRAMSCSLSLGRAINFVTVDFYDIGDGLEVVRALNQRTLTELSPAR